MQHGREKREKRGGNVAKSEPGGWSILEEPLMGRGGRARKREREGERKGASRGLGVDGSANIVGPYQFLLGIAYRSRLNVNLCFPSLTSVNSDQEIDYCRYCRYWNIQAVR